MNMDGKERLQRLIGPDYRLQWVVGQGGMSTVWLADDLRNNREVAIKVLRPEFADNTEFLSRFRNEAQAAENIDDPNVVKTYDYREVNDNGTFCFIVMEFIRGESLADLIAREGAIPEERALYILEQAACGLSTIHSLHLVHRDIKPGNIMVTPEDRVKITDFGIAKAAAAVPLTRTGMVVGTAQYVSPEQAQGQQVTAASDVYSLGVVGYELLAGRRPFTGDSSVSVAISHINDAAPPLPVSVSAPARELIAIAMRKDPARRFPEGGSFAQAISQVRLGQPPVDPSPSSVPTSYASPTQATNVMPVRTPAEVLASAHSPAPAPANVPAKKSSAAGWLAAVVLLALLLGGGGAWAYLNSQKKPEPAPVPVTSTAIPSTTSKQTPPPPPSTVYITSTQEVPSSEPTTTSSSQPTTKSKAPKTSEPKVSVTEAPLPTNLIEFPSLGLGNNGGNNGNGNGNNSNSPNPNSKKP